MGNAKNGTKDNFEIKVGDQVRWISQASGGYAEKQGQVLALIPPGVDASQFLPADVMKSHIKFQNKSTNERALVRVMAGKNKDIPHYYAARVSALEKMD